MHVFPTCLLPKRLHVADLSSCHNGPKDVSDMIGFWSIAVLEMNLTSTPKANGSHRSGLHRLALHSLCGAGGLKEATTIDGLI